MDAPVEAEDRKTSIRRDRSPRGPSGGRAGAHSRAVLSLSPGTPYSDLCEIGACDSLCRLLDVCTSVFQNALATGFLSTFYFSCRPCDVILVILLIEPICLIQDQPHAVRHNSESSFVRMNVQFLLNPFERGVLFLILEATQFEVLSQNQNCTGSIRFCPSQFYELRLEQY